MADSMIKFDGAEVASFRQVAGRIERETGRSTYSAMSQVGRFFLSSARAATPKAKRKREIVRNEDGNSRWAILRLTQTGPVLIPVGDAKTKKTDLTNDPRRIITRRGLAKACWMVAGAKAGLKRGGSIDSELSGDALRGAEGRHNNDRENPEWVISNQVPYIETLDRGGPNNPPHHILSTAMRKASSRVDGYLKNIAEKQARTWSR